MADVDFHEDAKATLVEHLKARIADSEWDGDAIEVTIADDVSLFWDTWSDPIVQIHADSPYYVEDPTHHALADYGENGDAIREFVDDAFAEADRRPTDWEISDSQGFHDFYAFGVMEEEH